MRFSLNTLISVTTLAAWFFGLVQVPRGYRGAFIASTILLIVLTLFAIAMTARRDEKTGMLDYEKCTLLNALEPTLKISLVLVGIAILTIVAFGIYGNYALSTF